MKLPAWIEMLQGMDPEINATIMYETEAGCVMNATPCNPMRVTVVSDGFRMALYVNGKLSEQGSCRGEGHTIPFCSALLDVGIEPKFIDTDPLWMRTIDDFPEDLADVQGTPVTPRPGPQAPWPRPAPDFTGHAEACNLVKRVYTLATTLWHRLVSAGGHPGVAGPSGDAPWDPILGTLTGAVTTLEQVVEHTPEGRPDPIRVLHELFESGDLEDHFYHIRESEGEGWEGPRMLRWGRACEQARQLLKGFKP
jgi:hypothetical protein